MALKTIQAFEEILEGKHDHMSENSFYSEPFPPLCGGAMLTRVVVGGIEDVKAKHEKSVKEQGN